MRRPVANEPPAHTLTAFVDGADVEGGLSAVWAAQGATTARLTSTATTARRADKVESRFVRNDA